MPLIKRTGKGLFAILIITMLTYQFLPLLSVFISKSPSMIFEKLQNPVIYEALSLSLRTTSVALIFIVGLGTPLAYWVAKGEFKGKKALEVGLKMPIVAPTAVVGVGLLMVFGQRGMFGGALDVMGITIPFTSIAVIMAQVFMASPFYITTARQAFEAVDDQLIAVSQTLGVNPWKTFWRVTIPLALPGLITGIALGWALALGEFGATMMFAGNLPGTTQTLPLAIYTAMESDADVALAISALLLSVSFSLLLLVSFIEKFMEKMIGAAR